MYKHKEPPKQRLYSGSWLSFPPLWSFHNYSLLLHILLHLSVLINAKLEQLLCKIGPQPPKTFPLSFLILLHFLPVSVQTLQAHFLLLLLLTLNPPSFTWFSLKSHAWESFRGRQTERKEREWRWKKYILFSYQYILHEILTSQMTWKQIYQAWMMIGWKRRAYIVEMQGKKLSLWEETEEEWDFHAWLVSQVHSSDKQVETWFERTGRHKSDNH